MTVDSIPSSRPISNRAPRAVAARQLGGPSFWKFRTRSAPYLFLLPYFLVTAVFFVYPLIYAAILAFYQTNGPRSRVFVGLENFRWVLADPDFHKAVWNTTVFAFFSIFL